MKTIAIIPARGGSKRLPGKNIRSFLGRPLITWSIRFAVDCGLFDRVLVSTDSEQIAEISRAAGVDVPYLRSAHLAGDHASSVDVVLDVLTREQNKNDTFDVVALLQPTSPIRDVSRWQAAFSCLGEGSWDAVVGVTPAKSHPFHVFERSAEGSLRPFFGADGLQMRSQDLPQAVQVAGNMYLVRSQVLQSERSFFPARTAGVVCDKPYEALDIDTEADWIVAEALAKHFSRST